MRNYNGLTPLCVACSLGRVDIAKLLLEENASVNTQSEVGYTPLHFAVLAGQTEVVKLLLQYNADRNKLDNNINKKSPLDYARSRKHIDILKLLVSHYFME